MDQLIRLVNQKVFRQFIQESVSRSARLPFAARQKRKKRKGILSSLFSLINRLVIMTMLVVLLRWWLQNQGEEKGPSGSAMDEEIPLDRYASGVGQEQPQTAPGPEPVKDGYEPSWPEAEVALSQAETGPVEESAASAGETDDLTLIEGIGPRISGVLQSAGIRTFRELADSDTGRIEEILQDSGLRLANPGTWPEQARLLADGNMEGLRELQSHLKAGRRTQE